MTTTSFDGIWRTSSRSASQGQCVEVALTASSVGVRDTKNRAAGHFVVTRQAWAAFTRRAKIGAYDI